MEFVEWNEKTKFLIMLTWIDSFNYYWVYKYIVGSSNYPSYDYFYLYTDKAD